MGALSGSQWVVVPLIVLTGAVEVIGFLMLFGYGLLSMTGRLRMSTSEVKANTPKLPR